MRRTTVLALLLAAAPAFAQPQTEEPPIADPTRAGVAEPGTLPPSVTAPEPAPRGMVELLPVGAGEPAPLPPRAAPDAPVPTDAARAYLAEDRFYPPPPVVVLRVVAPSVVRPGRDLLYTIVVENRSRAKAANVAVRVALPADAKVTLAKPEPAEKTAAEFVYRLGALPGGERRELQLALAVAAEGEVTLAARVAFEHGQAVSTRVAKPALQVKRTAPTEGAVNDPVTVRLEVTNPGPLPIREVSVTETLAEGLEFDRPDARWPAALVSTSRDGTQRTWAVGTLGPRQKQVIEYRLTPRRPGNRLCRATLTGAGGVAAESNGPLSVLEAKLGLRVTGPKTAFAGQPASYTVVVNNLGDLPLNNVRVIAALPAGVQPIRMSNDGRIFPDALQWVLTRLDPGGSRTLTFTIRAAEPGSRLVRVSARGDRGAEQSAEAETVFEGAAALNWRATTSEPGGVKIGDTFTYTVRVDNSGSAPAAGLAITAELPDSVTFVSATEGGQASGRVVRFPARQLAPGAAASYQFTVKATRPDQAVFRLEMAAEHLDPKDPVRSEPMTTIRGG